MQDKAFRFGVLNGILFAVVISTINPGLVLSAFFLKITNSTFLATLPFALMRIGSFLPQLLVSNPIELKELKKPYYIAAACVRVAFLIMMSLSAYLLGVKQPHVLAFIAAFTYLGYTSGMGVCSITFMDVVGKAIPANRRGSFFGLRGFFGGLLGFASGFFVRYILGDHGPNFPANYSLLFITAAVFQFAAMLAFIGVPEPIKNVRKDRLPFKKHLINGLSILKTDKNYRMLYIIRILNSVTYIGGMVFVPYALKELGMRESFIGVLMVISACFALPSNFLWSHIGDKYGNRLLMLISTFSYLTVPIVALISFYAPSITIYLPFFGEYDLRLLIFMVAFTLSAVTAKGRMMSDTNYLLDIAPEERRPSYLAFMSVLLAPTAIIPLIGGMIAELFSFHITFLVSLIFVIFAYILIFRLNEPRGTGE